MCPHLTNRETEARRAKEPCHSPRDRGGAGIKPRWTGFGGEAHSEETQAEAKQSARRWQAWIHHSLYFQLSVCFDADRF